MKIRNGFVSNSSTSSFVVAGIKVPNAALTAELRDELYEDGNLMVDDDGPKGFTVIGAIMADVSNDECYLDYSHFSLDEISKMIADVEVKTGLTGERGVFTGTRCC